MTITHDDLDTSESTEKTVEETTENTQTGEVSAEREGGPGSQDAGSGLVDDQQPASSSPRPSRWRRLFPRPAYLGVAAVDLGLPAALMAAGALGVRGMIAPPAVWIVVYVLAAVIGVAALVNVAGWWLPWRTTLGGRVFGVARAEGIPRGRKAATRAVFGLLALAVIVAAAGNVADMRGEAHRDAQTADMRAHAAGTASDIVTGLLTYKYSTVQTDVAAAQQRLTGQFADYFRTYTQQVVIPTAQQKQVVTAVKVAGAAVTAADADSATVLLMINQTTGSTSDPQPVTTSSDILVHLVRVGDELKLDRLNPV